MLSVGVSAATDITGFGLLGHLRELLLASGASARIESDRVPVLDGVVGLADAGVVPDGTRRNLASVEPTTRFAATVGPAQKLLLADAQTSGGLLIAVAPGRSQALEAAMLAGGVGAVRLGSVEEGPSGEIEVS
jgi:selenide,water dikinase